jgi:hypothetical protein
MHRRSLLQQMIHYETTLSWCSGTSGEADVVRILSLDCTSIVVSTRLMVAAGDLR